MARTLKALMVIASISENLFPILSRHLPSFSGGVELQVAGFLDRLSAACMISESGFGCLMRQAGESFGALDQ